MFFVTRGKKPDVVRYVSGVKTWFGMWTKVDCTVDHKKAVALDAAGKAKAAEAIRKKYGEAVEIDTAEEMGDAFDDPRLFYVIVSEDKRRETYFASISKYGKLTMTENVREAYISQSKRDIEETLVNVRAHGGKKVKAVAVAMNIDNTLQEGNFVIVCKSKFSGKLRFLKSRYMNGNIALNPKSKAAERLGFDDAMEWYEWLKEAHKKNYYAVTVAPEEDINASQLARYVKEHGTKRNVAISVTLPK